MTSAIISKFIFFGLITLAVILEVVGDTFFKKWAIDRRNIFLAIGILIYFIGSIFWVISLKYEYLSKAISVFTVLNMIILVLVGVMYFKEDLSVMNKIGIALGILGVVLIEIRPVRTELYRVFFQKISVFQLFRRACKNTARFRPHSMEHFNLDYKHPLALYIIHKRYTSSIKQLFTRFCTGNNRLFLV